MTTIKQMKARMLPGHRKVLEAMRDGQAFATPTDCEARGYLKMFRTLSKWGAVDHNGLTDIGRKLLDGEEIWRREGGEGENSSQQRRQEMLFHAHEPDSTVDIRGCGHVTYKGIADWFFVCEVTWRPGEPPEWRHVAPVHLGCDDAGMETLKDATRRLTDYLNSRGEWHEPKYKRDGRVYYWTPTEPDGEEIW